MYVAPGDTEAVRVSECRMCGHKLLVMLWMCLSHVCQMSRRITLMFVKCLAGPLRCPCVKVTLQLYVRSN